jgi:Pyruvate/2-oxoacid:ferredoxin oxidoreductase delta subunit
VSLTTMNGDHMSLHNEPADSKIDGFLKEQVETFCAIMMVPAFMIPWLNAFYEPKEIRFILELNQQQPPDVGIKRLAERTAEIARHWPADFLARCHRRAVINLDDDGMPTPADFHARYEIWALFEGWQNLPREIKDRLNQWELQSFVDRKKPHMDAYEKSGQRDRSVVWPEYVLLDEALALIQKVPHIYLWPCNCRAMIQGCKKPGFVCLRFTNDRNLGWEISKERAREIILAANKKGLMQSAEVGIAPDGSLQGAICNCCSDCCFPVQFSRQLKDPRLYPLSRYVAIVDEERCSECGRCARRCPFQAFTVSKKSSESGEGTVTQIHFNVDSCRGCGVCSTVCPEGAIEMQPLALSPLSIIADILPA